MELRQGELSAVLALLEIRLILQQVPVLIQSHIRIAVEDVATLQVRLSRFNLVAVRPHLQHRVQLLHQLFFADQLQEILLRLLQ